MYENIKTRLILFAQHIGMNDKNFEASIGMPKCTLRRMNSDVKANVISQAVRQYPQLSPDWLLTGDGQMLRSFRSHPSVINTTAPIQSNSSVIHTEPIQTEESATDYLEAPSASSRHTLNPQGMVSEPTLSDIPPNRDTGPHIAPGTLPNRDTGHHLSPGTMPNRDSDPHLTTGTMPNRDTITLPVRVYDELLDQLRKKDKQLEDAAAQIKHLFDMLNAQKPDQ